MVRELLKRNKHAKVFSSHLKRNEGLGNIMLTEKGKVKGHMGCFDTSQTKVGRLAL